MISPTESLAFSMHANPGVYAVLLGSGVSRAAKIPTGWEITLDLIRQLAALRKKPCEPDPERWYQNTFGKELDYSDLLDELCPTPAERQQLLRAYFEPISEDPDEGAKQPTPAHHAIAALAAGGFIRIVLTTNFDRLIETALENAGVRPAVLSTRDHVQGALPLIHTRCCVVKLHGDYLDTRIRNTRPELDRYSPEFDRLLDRIFDEFGLVVCGWSATWDRALCAALQRASSRRFMTYWAVHGEVEDEARRLIEHRAARKLPIKDADEFFGCVHRHVESLQEFARPHPLSTETAVASLKRYLAEPRHRIRLSDLVDDVVDQVVASTADAVDGSPSRWDDAAVEQQMQSIEAACSTLLAVGVTGGTWTEEEQEEHIRPWKRALERLGSRNQPATNDEVDFRAYRAILLLHALGLGAVEAGRFWTLGRLLGTRVRTNYREEEIAALTLHPAHLSKSDPFVHSTLTKRLRECLRPHARRIVPDATRYTIAFDKLEIHLGLAYCRARAATSRSMDTPFWNFPENGCLILNDIEESLSSRGDDSPFVKSRIFGATEEECRRILKELRPTVPSQG